MLNIYNTVGKDDSVKACRTQ